MSHSTQIYHQRTITDVLLPDQCDSPNQNTSPTTPKTLNMSPLPPDDDQQDDSDTAFDYDLVLPPPNPLPRKTPSARDPLLTLFDYPLQKAHKFLKKELLEALPGQESGESYKNNARIYSERVKEAFLIRDDNGDENKEQKKLCDYFAEEEKIVYRRRIQTEGESFNQTCINVKTQLKRAMEDSEIGSEVTGDNVQPEVKENTLRFESRFESGNLAMASMVNENEYNLILQNDVNTYGFGQWFFFAVMNTKKNQTVKFNILNYRKLTSLHNLGMKVLVYSVKEAKKSNTGWTRTTKADYFPNSISRENPRIIRPYRTLSFDYNFKHNADCVFFAYSIPYTYSDLLDYLDSIETDEVKSRYFGRSTLCKTLAGNKCELVTITQKSKTVDNDKKKCIFLTSRVHPGETNSSFIIQGLMEFLLSNSKEAESLREKFIFKIIPMLNPDGVIHGNSRCSLAGCDLNRKWRKPSPKLHPTIYNAKILASELNQKYGVILYCDFHGHSKKRDAFLYGCQEGGFPAEAREFAFVLGKVTPLFSYRKSSFFMEAYKFGAARIALYQEFKIKCSYTLEASFFGPEKTGKPYSIEELLDLGAKFCKAILLQFSKEVATKKASLKEVEQELADAKQKMIEELYADQNNFLNNDPDSGSESEISEDELPRTVMKDLLPKPKKRPPTLKRQPTKSPLRIPKPVTGPPPTLPASVPVPVALAEAKILKLSLEKTTPLRERYFPKVTEIRKPEKLASPPREVSAMMLGEQEPFESFCFVVRRLEGKYEAKTESVRRQMTNTFQEGFSLTTEIKSGYESLVLQEKRAEREKERERDEKSNRVSKDRKRAINFIDAKRPGNLSVTNTKVGFPSLIERSSPTSFGALKHIRSLKELKSGRDMKILEENEMLIENVEENDRTEIRENIKDILESKDFGEFKEVRDLKDMRSPVYLKDSREMKDRDIRELKDLRETPQMVRDSNESQVRHKLKKQRLPHTLEPLSRCTITTSFDKLDTEAKFKTKTKIMHTGFQKRSEEDGSILKESLKEYSREGHKTLASSIKEMLNLGFKWENLGSLDRWKYNVMMAEEHGKDNIKVLNSIVSPKKPNLQERESVTEDLQISMEYISPHRRVKKMENSGRISCTVEGKISKKQANASARGLDMKIPGSLVNTPSKPEFNGIQSLIRHKSPLKS